MKKYLYLLCLEKNYDVELGNNEETARATLEDIIDELVYLLESYGIDEDEILDYFKEHAEVKEAE